MSRGTDEKAQPEQDASREDSGSKKGRGLLGASSKGSSQQVQSSSAATGLSGATANEPRNSIGGHSKESRSSRLGRRRNGSVASNRSGLARTTTNPTASQPNATGAPQKRKKGGLLALLGCCGVPNNANALEAGEDPLPPHKLDKIPQRPITSSRRTMTPSEQTTASKTQLPEKEKETAAPAQVTPAPAQDAAKAQPPSASTEQHATTDRTLENRQPANVAVPGPSITVNPPVAETKEGEQAQAAENTPQDGDGDVVMPDAEASAPPAATSQPAQEPANPADEQLAKPMPPPPPGPIPLTSAPPASQGETSIASEESEQQKALLPPIEPHLKGRKCLVLDLDETLVHSSFKVSFTVLT